MLTKWPCASLIRYICFPGGTPESQREFLDTLSADASDPNLSNDRRKGRVPPVANQFALGYTYQDVLDADQEGKYDHTYTPSKAFSRF